MHPIPRENHIVDPVAVHPSPPRRTTLLGKILSIIQVVLQAVITFAQKLFGYVHPSRPLPIHPSLPETQPEVKHPPIIQEMITRWEASPNSGHNFLKELEKRHNTPDLDKILPRHWNNCREGFVKRLGRYIHSFAQRGIIEVDSGHEGIKAKGHCREFLNFIEKQITEFNDHIKEKEIAPIDRAAFFKAHNEDIRKLVDDPLSENIRFDLEKFFKGEGVSEEALATLEPHHLDKLLECAGELAGEGVLAPFENSERWLTTWKLMIEAPQLGGLEEKTEALVKVEEVLPHPNDIDVYSQYPLLKRTFERTFHRIEKDFFSNRVLYDTQEDRLLHAKLNSAYMGIQSKIKPNEPPHPLKIEMYVANDQAIQEAEKEKSLREIVQQAQNIYLVHLVSENIDIQNTAGFVAAGHIMHQQWPEDHYDIILSRLDEGIQNAIRPYLVAH